MGVQVQICGVSVLFCFRFLYDSRASCQWLLHGSQHDCSYVADVASCSGFDARGTCLLEHRGSVVKDSRPQAPKVKHACCRAREGVLVNL